MLARRLLALAEEGLRQARHGLRLRREGVQGLRLVARQAPRAGFSVVVPYEGTVYRDKAIIMSYKKSVVSVVYRGITPSVF